MRLLNNIIRGNKKEMLLTKDEKGFALVLSLVIMAAMTAIGLAAVTTATTDLMIARNEREAKEAFYLAETGVNEAVMRIALSEKGSGAARRVGETATERENRKNYWGGTGSTYNNKTTANSYEFFFITSQLGGVLTSSDFAMAHTTFRSSTATAQAGDVEAVPGVVTHGRYEVTVNYTQESDNLSVETWTNSAVDRELVVYCKAFGFESGSNDCKLAAPVYKITSVGTTGSGTSTTIVAYVTSAFVNLLPPGDTILFTEGEIFVQDNRDVQGYELDYSVTPVGVKQAGKVASLRNKVNNTSMYVENCGNGAGEVCKDVTSTVTIKSLTPSGAMFDDSPGEGMQTYLGADVTMFKAIADVTDESFDKWGVVCSIDTTYPPTAADINKHICDDGELNEAGAAAATKLIYIDPPSGKVTVNSTFAGRGLLIVNGDLVVNGNITWEGMIYVMGELTVAGNPIVYGTLMARGDGDNAETMGSGNADVKISGSLTLNGSRDIAQSVSLGLSLPKMLSWTRI